MEEFEMSIAYGILCVISLALIGVCLAVDRKKDICNHGNIPESQQAANYEKARRAFLIGYDRSVPKLRQADHCIGCNQCNSHCPQRINIPRELTRIDQFVEKLKQGTL